MTDTLNCSICFEKATDPLFTPCIHGFCKACIMRWIDEKSESLIIMCPVCKSDITDLMDLLEHDPPALVGMDQVLNVIFAPEPGRAIHITDEDIQQSDDVLDNIIDLIRYRNNVDILERPRFVRHTNSRVS